MRKIRYFLSVLCMIPLFFLTGCQQNTVIVSSVDEREANEIIVFLAGKGIPSSKIPATSSAPGAGQTGTKWSIGVPAKNATDAMAILNQNGLPRIKGTNLLDLFAKQGMMSSDQEDKIRYQAGLSEQIAGTIRQIDGVINASVQISFPNNDSSNSALPWGQNTPQKVTAAVYVKHQGVLDDPNSHLVLKIKRLVAGSVNGLDINDVTVISDRARFADVTLGQTPEVLSPGNAQENYVSIWSIVMSKESASRFRTVFFFLCFFMILFALLAAWLIWKLYPILKTREGRKTLVTLTPFLKEPSLPLSSEEQTPDQEAPK